MPTPRNDPKQTGEYIPHPELGVGVEPQHDPDRTTDHGVPDSTGPIVPLAESLESESQEIRISSEFDSHAALGENPDRSGAAASGPLVLAGESHVPHSLPKERKSDSAGSDIPTIPGYEVERVLAQGGMGKVLAARDLSLGRDVAIKVLLRTGSAEEAAQRFILESKITARLPHPAIPPVYQLGTLADGNPFLAMKLIRGRNLAEEVKASTLPAELPRFVQIFEQIAQAVGFAHSQNIIHRDLKPSNVMVGAFGEVLVMDWGLAKEITAAASPAERVVRDWAREAGNDADSLASDLTREGYVMGTVAYMAPEQARGEPLGPPADVFALGGILCDILTRHAPFGGRTLQESLRRAAAGDLSEAFARLDTCGADADLIALCKHLLSPDVANRPVDGKAAADAVAAYRAGVEERFREAETQRVAAEARLVEQRKRRRVQVALVGSLALLFAAGGGFAWWKGKADARQAQTEAARVAADAETERQKHDAQERLHRNRDAIANLLARLEPELRAGHSPQIEESLLQAENRMNEGGADELLERLRTCRREFDMLRQLDRIDEARWTLVEGRLPLTATIDELFTRAFADYGIQPDAASSKEVARRVNDSLIRTRLLTSLETWRLLSDKPAGLVAILSAADPDPFRNEVRRKSYALALRNPAFKDNPRLNQQPIWFAIATSTTASLNQQARSSLLDSAYRAEPDNFTLLMTLGGTGRENDEVMLRSVGWYRAALAVRPNSSVAWNNLGQMLHYLGRRTEALEAYRKAVSLDEKFTGARNNLGVCLRQLGDHAGSLAVLKEAVLLNPKDPVVHTNLGNALADSGDVKGAIAAFKKAIELDEKHSVAIANLGYLMAKRGDVAGGLAEINKAIQLNPKNAALHFQLGRVLEYSDKCADAVASLRTAVELDPRFPGVYTALANALRGAGNLPEAAEAAREAIKREPTRPDGYVALGQVLTLQGNPAQAIPEYKKAIELDSKSVEAHLQLAAAYVLMKRFSDAIAPAKTVTQLNPKGWKGHYLLVVALNGAGDRDGAKAAYDEGMRQVPKKFEALFPPKKPTPSPKKPPQPAPPPHDAGKPS